MPEGSGGALRVVQWTTGNVAVEAVKALIQRPDVELVGAYAYSPDKALVRCVIRAVTSVCVPPTTLRRS